jgi:hypothetical protein
MPVDVALMRKFNRPTGNWFCVFDERRSVVRKLIVGFLLIFTSAMAGDLKVSWQANSEPDLAGYFVYYGARTGFYRYRLSVGRQTEYTIRGVAPGETYFIAVTAADNAGNESAFSEPIRVRTASAQDQNNNLPQRHQLLPSYPNPFDAKKHNKATFTFELYEPARVKLQIYDVLGHVVATLINAERPAGVHKISWDGYDRHGLPARTGIYFYRLQTPGQTISRKLIIYR